MIAVLSSFLLPAVKVSLHILSAVLYASPTTASHCPRHTLSAAFSSDSLPFPDCTAFRYPAAAMPMLKYPARCPACRSNRRQIHRQRPRRPSHRQALYRDRCPVVWSFGFQAAFPPAFILCHHSGCREIMIALYAIFSALRKFVVKFNADVKNVFQFFHLVFPKLFNRDLWRQCVSL